MITTDCYLGGVDSDYIPVVCYCYSVMGIELEENRIFFKSLEKLILGGGVFIDAQQKINLYDKYI